MTDRQTDAWHSEWHGNPGAPPVLLLHGFMGSGDDWQEIIRRLSPQFHLLTLDLPGHGRNIASPPASRRMPAVARRLAELLRAAAPDKWRIIGYSMGGRLALYLVLHYPELFTQAVLESASPGLKTAAERRNRREQDERLARELETGNFQDFLHRWYRMPLFATLRGHPRFRQILNRRLKNHPAELAVSLRQMGTGSQPALWERLPSNKIPMLLLTGELDIKFRGIAAEIVERTPRATMRVIEGCGHNIHFENPALFADAVSAFFTG